eukprot:6044628-Heterocapsa_arctica.AAC.1
MLLREEFLRILKKVPPLAMRAPTINEVKLVDRLIHQDVLSFVAKDEGTLADGLKWYLNDGRSHNLWSLLEAQIEIMPDRGIERPPGPLKRKFDA